MPPRGQLLQVDQRLASAWRCGRRARAGSRGSSSRGRTASPATRAPTSGIAVAPSPSSVKSRPALASGGACSSRNATQLRAERLVGRRSTPSFTALRWLTPAREEERRDRAVGLRRAAAPAAASTESIVHGLSLVASVSGRQPSSSCTTPPCTLTTWPLMPLAQVGRQPAGDRGDVLGGEAVEAVVVGLHDVAGEPPR